MWLVECTDFFFNWDSHWKSLISKHMRTYTGEKLNKCHKWDYSAAVFHPGLTYFNTQIKNHTVARNVIISVPAKCNWWDALEHMQVKSLISVSLVITVVQTNLPWSDIAEKHWSEVLGRSVMWPSLCTRIWKE